LLGIIDHRLPVTENIRSKQGRYFLKDNFYRFYARFIYKNMSLYQSARFDLLIEKTLTEWNAFTGRAFEELAREMLREELVSKYERIGSWWNRRGDEIDLLALGTNKALAVEIKNMELSSQEALSHIEDLKRKIELVKGIEGEINFGIAARKISGKEKIREEGYFAWDLDDLKIIQ